MASRSLWLCLPLAVIVGAAVACTHTETKEVPTGDDDDDDDAGGPALADLQFRPAELYSGFDGTHPFQTPFAVYNFDDDVEVTASPASAVTITEKSLSSAGNDKGKYYFATAKADGDVKLTVTSKGRSASGTLHITKYDAGRYATGEARYGTGPDEAHPPCTKCHGEGGIDHSPSALASLTDEKVGLIMSTGLSSIGHTIVIDKTAYPDGHKWTSGPGAEQDGLITFLRALEPKGFK